LVTRPYHILVLIGIAVAACGDPGDSSVAARSHSARDSAGVTLVALTSITDVRTCELAGGPAAVIGAGASEENQLYRVRGAARLSNGRLVVLNGGANEVRFYSGSGEFLESFGRSGEGPGEFQAIDHMAVLPGDTIWVADFRPLTYEVFDPSGSWVRHVRLTPPVGSSPSGAGVLDDGSAILAQRDLRRLRDFLPGRIAVHQYSPTGELVDTVGVYETAGVGETTNPRRSIAPWFASWTFVSAVGERLIIADSRRSEVVLRALPTLAPSMIIRWNAGDRTPTPAIMREARQFVRDQYRTDENSSTAEMYLDDRRPVEDPYPAYARAQLGRDGGVWIERYDPVSNDGTGVWVGLDTEGLPHCELELPQDAFVWEFGDGYALIGRRGDLGVERVELYRWDPPGDVP